VIILIDPAEPVTVMRVKVAYRAPSPATPRTIVFWCSATSSDYAKHSYALRL